MRPARAAFAAIILGLASACQPAPDEQARTAAADQPEAAAHSVSFDFYVLSLSWSPTYCEVEGADANRRQCGGDRDLAFVVHGLWPQYEKGWPEFCDSNEPDRVPNAIVGGIIDLMPSAGLIGHQWRKHGSCSGLSQRDYFRLVRQASAAVAVPETLRSAERRTDIAPADVERRFLDANPALTADGIAVTCDGGLIDEVRICLTQDLRFRACTEIDRRACRRSSAVMPAAP